MCSTIGDDEEVYPDRLTGVTLDASGVSGLLEEPEVVSLLALVPGVPDAKSSPMVWFIG